METKKLVVFFLQKETKNTALPSYSHTQPQDA